VKAKHGFVSKSKQEGIVAKKLIRRPLTQFLWSGSNVYPTLQAHS